MTKKFRIDQFRLETVQGPVVYNFPDDLTVLAGDTGVGKTTLFELIKFALGGNALIAPVAVKNVSAVHLSLQIGAERLALSRELDDERRKHVRLTDLVTGEVQPRVPVSSDKERTVSDILLTALGLSTTMRAAARSASSSRKGALITFYDLFRYMYVPQAAINQDIAGSRETYYEPKRKSVFELLFGLTDADVLDMQSEMNELNARFAEASREAATINQFLIHSGMQSRIDAELALAQAIQEERQGQETLAHLANEVEQVVDRETQILRELLSDSERALNEAQDLVASLDREAARYRAERRDVEQDIARLHQMASAGQRLASIEFVVCPRCTQSLTRRTVPDHTCRVCMQPDNVAETRSSHYETEQLIDQVEEVDLQLTVIAKQGSEAAEAVRSRKKLVASLTAQIESRTASRVTPRLQAYTDAAAKAARAKARQEHLEEILQRWDRAQDLQVAAEELERQRVELKTAIGAANSRLNERRRQVLGQLSDEFASTVAAFRIPAGQGASIDPKSYLPLLDGQPFSQVSSAGGIATATQVAYWISLLTVATRLNDTAYPGFLMIDSPRLAVSSTEDIAGQMYARFVTQVGVVPGRLQFIVADNEMPRDYVRQFTEFKFSYEDPTISTIAHPGPAEVVPLAVESPSAT